MRVCVFSLVLAAVVVVSAVCVGSVRGASVSCCTYAAVKSAVEGATDGEVIELADGVYTGCVSAGITVTAQGVTIRPQSGATVVIDCSADGSPVRGFIFDGTDAVMEDITVKGALLNGAHPAYSQHAERGAGVLVVGGAPTLRRVTIQGNSVVTTGGGALQGDGGGLALIGTQALVDACVVRDNSAADRGGGILVDYPIGPEGPVPGRGVLIRNTLIKGNQANVAGGVGFESAVGSQHSPNRTSLLDECTIVDNWTNGFQGGGMAFQWHFVNISRCNVSSNSAAGNGGGARVSHSSVVTILDSTVGWNLADSGGGLHVISSGTLTLERCNVTGNKASFYGAGIDVLGGVVSATASVRDSRISGNSAAFEGGGMAIGSSAGGTKVTVERSELTGNEAWFGGGIATARQAAAGFVSLTVSGSTVTGNQARNTYGGGLVFATALGMLSDSVVSDNVAAGSGGGVEIRSATTVKDVQVERNTAGTLGGGVHVQTATATLERVLANDNTAVQDGGGLAAAATSTIVLKDFSAARNTAGVMGGGVYIAGSLSVSAGTLTLSSNTAGGSGGGLASDSAATVVVQVPMTVTGNSAGSEGGGILTQGSDLALPLGVASAAVLSSNTATYGGGLAAVTPGILSGLAMTFSGNTAHVSGGGALIRSSAAAYGTATPILDACVFDGNVAEGGAGGGALIKLLTGTALFRGLTMTGNRAVSGGGLAVYGNVAGIEFESVTVTGNTASGDGGGVCVVNTTGVHALTLRGLTASANVAGRVGGGFGVIADSGHDVDLNLAGTVALTGNTAGSVGGGFGVAGVGRVAGVVGVGTGDSVVSGNVAPVGAAVWVGRTAGPGGVGDRLTLTRFVVGGHVSEVAAAVHFGFGAGVDVNDMRVAGNNATGGGPMVETAVGSAMSLASLSILDNFGSGIVVGDTLGLGQAVDLVVTNNTYRVERPAGAGTRAATRAAAAAEVAGIVCGTNAVGGVSITVSGADSLVCRNLVLGLANATFQDIGASCGVSGVISAAPLRDCPPMCGNGFVEAGEECDDYNLESGDGCGFCIVEIGWLCSHSTATPSQCEVVPAPEPDPDYGEPAGVLTVIALGLLLLAILMLVMTVVKRRRTQVAAAAAIAGATHVYASFWRKFVVSHPVVGLAVYDATTGDPYTRGGRTAALALSSAVILLSITATPLVNQDHFTEMAESGGVGQVLVWVSSSIVGTILSLIFGVPLVKRLCRTKSPAIQARRKWVYLGAYTGACVAVGLAAAIVLAVANDPPSLLALAAQWGGTLVVEWVFWTLLFAIVRYYLWSDRIVWRRARDDITLAAALAPGHGLEDEERSGSSSASSALGSSSTGGGSSSKSGSSPGHGAGKSVELISVSSGDLDDVMPPVTAAPVASAAPERRASGRRRRGGGRRSMTEPVMRRT